MKTLLYAILDKTPDTEELLRALSKEGYNGTVIDTMGLKHVLPKLKGKGALVSLSEMVDDAPKGNIALFVIIEEERLEDLKSHIREATQGFTKVKGGMFVLPLLSVEGNF